MNFSIANSAVENLAFLTEHNCQHNSATSKDEVIYGCEARVYYCDDCDEIARIETKCTRCEGDGWTHWGTSTVTGNLVRVSCQAEGCFNGYVS